MSVKETILKSIKASIGLILFAFGVYLTVQADIGLAPWDVFAMGISYYVPLTFGQVSIVIAFVIIAIDIFMKEKIGIGTILDAILVGTFIDVFENSKMLAKSENLVISILLLIVGMFIMAYSQYLYMSAGLSCGPKDSFQIGLGKRLKKVPIGVVNIIILSVVLVAGFFLKGPIGIGTVCSVAGIGLIQQIVFNFMKFEPREITHISIREMMKK